MVIASALMLTAFDRPLWAQASDLSLATPWLWPPLLERFWLIWLAFLGGAIGSFLNVVVYRWPIGESLTHPPSRCPACRHPIRPWHNVPVLGWLWLRGKCRDCGNKISPRYPLVEATTAGLFALLAAIEVFPAAANLPGYGLPYTGPPIWLLYGYHAWLWSALVAGALIAYDGQPIPGKLLLATLAVGVISPLFGPGLHPVRALPVQMSSLPSGPLWLGLCNSVVGLAAGCAVTGLSCLVGPRANRRQYQRQWLLGYTSVGAFLGWQALCGIAAIAGAVHLAAPLVQSRSRAVPTIPWLTWLAAATVLWICIWSTIATRLPISTSHNLGSLALLSGFAIALLAHYIERRFAQPANAGRGV